MCRYDMLINLYDIFPFTQNGTAVPDPPPPRRPVSMSAIHTSITYENSANPVIRAAAASVMDIAEHQDPTGVAEERKRTKVKRDDIIF